MMSTGDPLPWRKHYVGRTDQLYRHLAPSCIGIMVRLEDYYWASGSLPASLKELQKICGAQSKKEWDSAWELLQHLFPLNDDGVRVASNLVEEREKAHRKYRQRSYSAAKGWADRKLVLVDGDKV